MCHASPTLNKSTGRKGKIMNNEKSLSHDTQLFSRMVDILFTSGTGKHNYGVDIKDRGTLASVMNDLGFTNKFGGRLNANSIYQIIHRMRQDGYLDSFAPDWSEFSSPSAEHHKFQKMVNMNSDRTKKEYRKQKRKECLVCGGDLFGAKKVRLYGETLCSPECHSIYKISVDGADPRLTTEQLFALEQDTTH